ncbi:MAG: substrate-binding domain-containing protein [Cyanobacteriota bacterium]
MTCPTCGSHDISKNGTTRRGKQNYKCRDCNRQFVENPQWKPKDIDYQSVKGFDHIVHGHLEVAHAIATGEVSAGISTESVASAFGLGFIPLHRSRYDLVVLKSYLEEPSVQQLLSTSGHRRVLSQLQALGGYDTSQTGEVVATVNPA